MAFLCHIYGDMEIYCVILILVPFLVPVLILNVDVRKNERPVLSDGSLFVNIGKVIIYTSVFGYALFFVGCLGGSYLRQVGLIIGIIRMCRVAGD